MAIGIVEGIAIFKFLADWIGDQEEKEKPSADKHAFVRKQITQWPQAKKIKDIDGLIDDIVILLNKHEVFK